MRLIEEIVKNSFLVIASLNPYLVYFVVGLLSFLECAAFLGLFVPGETFVVLAGILASKHIIEIRILLLVVLICAFLGDVVGFLIGRKYGFSFLEKFKRNRFLPSSYIEKTKEFFDRYGAKTMVIARFVGFLRAAAPFLSGASKTRFREFIFFDFLGASAWTLVFALGGFYLGESFSLVEKYIGRGGVILFLSIVAVLVGRKVITSTVKAAQNLSRRYAGELLLSLSFLSGLGLIVYLSREARQADIIFELEILRFLSSISNDFLTIVFAIFTAFGSGYFVTFTIIAALFAFILRKRYYEGLLFAVAVAISNLLSAILKIVIRTERPKIPLIVEPLRSFSFPSGHVVASSLIFWVLGWIIFRESKGRLKWLSFLFFAIPLGVGLSRLYFGYHWPVDVLGGYAVSFSVFSFWVYFYEKGLLRRKTASYGKDFHRNQ